MHPALVALLVSQLTFAPAAQPTPLGADSLPHVPHPSEVARRPDVVYTDAYYRRLDIHRKASYLILPMFALQLAAGTQLIEKSIDAPTWAKVGHRIGATGVAALFATNLVTGVPNLVVAWKDPNDRRRRMLHTTLMLAASAGFTATGILAERAEGDPDARELHRTVAYTSMGLAAVAYLSMLDLFRGN